MVQDMPARVQVYTWKCNLSLEVWGSGGLVTRDRRLDVSVYTYQDYGRHHSHGQRIFFEFSICSVVDCRILFFRNLQENSQDELPRLAITCGWLLKSIILAFPLEKY